MRRRAPLLTILCLAHLCVAEQKAPETQPTESTTPRPTVTLDDPTIAAVRNYMKQSKRLVPREIERLTEYIGDYPKRLRKVQRAKYPNYQMKRKAIQELQADRKAAIQRLKDAKAGKIYPPPWIYFDEVDLKTGKGTIGKISMEYSEIKWNPRIGGVGYSTPWTILQVIDKTNMLIGTTKGKGTAIWLADYDTTNCVDGQNVPRDLQNKVFQIVDTRTYNAAFGGTNTVMVGKIIKIDRLIKAVKALDEQKRIDQAPHTKTPSAKKVDQSTRGANGG